MSSSQLLNKVLSATIISGSIISVGCFLFKVIQHFTKKKEKKVKKGILEMMKNTPLLYIKSLSELTGCEIYGKCEYMLPYTSKDRMIKNIILNARE